MVSEASSGKKKSKKKWVIIAVVLIVVLVTIFIVPRLLGSSAGSGSTSEYAENIAKKGNVTSAVETNGNITDNIIEEELPYGVTVNDLKVDEGDYVNDGDKLVEFSSSSLDSKIDDVVEEIDKINSKIEDQSDSSENVKALKERKSQLIDIKKELSKISKKDAVYASGNGVIENISIFEGSKLYKDNSNTDTVTTTETGVDTSDESRNMSVTSLRDEYFGSGITVFSNDTMSMDVDIDELDIATVKIGQDTQITLDALPDAEFTGKVTHINNQVSINNGVVKYTAKIEFEKSDNMKTGMNAGATIIRESKENILLVPINAVQEDSNGMFVYTSLEDNTPGKIIRVTTGLSDGVNVEILSGLSEGDKIYYKKPSSMSIEQMMTQSDNGEGGTPSEDTTSGDDEQNAAPGNE